MLTIEVIDLIFWLLLLLIFLNSLFFIIIFNKINKIKSGENSFNKVFSDIFNQRNRDHYPQSEARAILKKNQKK